MTNKQKLIQGARNHFDKSVKEDVQTLICVDLGDGNFETGAYIREYATAVCMLGSLVTNMCKNGQVSVNKMLKDTKKVIKISQITKKSKGEEND